MRAYFYSSLIIFAVLTSCEEHQQEQATATPPAQADSVNLSECYSYMNGDTVQLHTNNLNGNITGELTYKFNEKDMNQGLINGIMKGDTLIADYTFQSEGVESVREVAFLKIGVDYAEGHGEMQPEGKKMVFKSLKKITFTKDMMLRKTPCPK